jgi:hypothetical protein
MVSLADALERFNRKERNLLMRHILGHGVRPELHPDFCPAIGKILNLYVPVSAWWGTDYHISWIAGALALCCRDKGVFGPWPNPPRDISRQPKQRKIAEGNQEDVDLLIAFDANLIIIEAKGYGSWDDEQLRSKLARLQLVREFYNEKLECKHNIHFYLLLISPNPPGSRDVIWPCWSKKSPDEVHIPLIQPLRREDVLEVGRCNSQGRRQQEDSDSWGIFGLQGTQLKEI